MQSSNTAQSPKAHASSRVASPETPAPSLFPAFLKLAGRYCLVVGAGAVGESKIKGLLAAGAKVNVVAPRAGETVYAWARAGMISWQPRGFEPSDLERVFLVVVATSFRELNEEVYRQAQERGVLCNVVDDPMHCDFYYPAVVRRGALQIAISTDGKSPALAQRLRQELERQFGPEYGAWMEDLGEERQRLFRKPMDAELRRRLLHSRASRESFEKFARRAAVRPMAFRKGMSYEGQSLSGWRWTGRPRVTHLKSAAGAPGG